jgi:DNA-binding SARP family transcriptional activator
LLDEGVSKEDIGEALWPEVTEDVQKIRFKNSIYRLRHALGSEVIDYTGDVYRFNRQMEYDFDVENFLQHVQMAHLLKKGLKRSPSSRSRFLLQGGFFAKT